LEDWKIGKLEDWKIGRLEDWKIGVWVWGVVGVLRIFVSCCRLGRLYMGQNPKTFSRVLTVFIAPERRDYLANGLNAYFNSIFEPRSGPK
jgi:hypothetical protein